jgi:hypothetical protein
MRITLEIVAILESAWLAFVGVHGEHWRRLRAHKRPFAPGRKARTAETPQTSIAYDLDQFVTRALVGQTGFQQGVAAGFLISGEIDIGRPRVSVRLRPRGRRDRIRRRLECLYMTHRANRRAIAGPHAGRAHDANIASEFAGKVLQQPLGAGHRAGQRIAHPHRDGRRRQFAFLHDIEMRIEGRDLVDLRERHLHLGGERGKVSR